MSDYLLDTHALLWWLLDDPQLPEKTRAEIAEPENRIWVSAACAWEIATKHRLGKLSEAGDINERLPFYLRKARFLELPVTVAHSLRAGMLPGPHRDPFDRMLIAQHQITGHPVITRDPVFGEYGVVTLWS